MIKELYKLSDNYFLGLYFKNNVEYLGIFSGNKLINYLVIHIDFQYEHILDYINSNYSKELLTSRVSGAFHFDNDKTIACYYFFVTEIIEKYNIDVNNFDYYFAKLILNILKNQIFV